ncbi:MAG: hypothetical protein JWM88_1740 [Verrucomicrobia bacterium]|nr:hypothetical protein [Verrucomicrobiota bacterium]
MLLLAAATAATTLEKLRQIPSDFWWKLGLVVVGLIVVVLVLRKIAGMNKVVLAIIMFVVVTIVGFNWIYERNEPAFLTPLVDKIAPFLPAKGSYNAKQASSPSSPKK